MAHANEKAVKPTQEMSGRAKMGNHDYYKKRLNGAT